MCFQVTYNTLIDVYGKLGRWEDALQVLQRMKTQVSMLHIYHVVFIACDHVYSCQIPVYPLRGWEIVNDLDSVDKASLKC